MSHKLIPSEPEYNFMIDIFKQYIDYYYTISGVKLSFPTENYLYEETKLNYYLILEASGIVDYEGQPLPKQMVYFKILKKRLNAWMILNDIEMPKFPKKKLINY